PGQGARGTTRPAPRRTSKGRRVSRNLGRTDCYFCHGRVELDEAPRPITQKECRIYFDEYEGMLVANAHCFDCDARYLAWVDEGPRIWYPPSAGERRGAEPGSFVDLSFRSTFDDEPGPDDLSRYDVRIIRERTKIETCTECGKRHAK